MENYAQQELALRLRKRQAELLERIRQEGESGQVTQRLIFLAKAKQNVDWTLADIAEELGWQQGYDKMLDNEIAAREDARRVWGA
jgi:hypothetical protein